MQPSEHRSTEAVIDLSALKHNISQLMTTKTSTQLFYATVKGDGYGHGAPEVSRVFIDAGADGLCVATVDEGIELRQNGLIGMPILVLGLTDPCGVQEVLYYDLTITVGSFSFFEAAYQQLEKTKSLHLLKRHPLKFHLALDTGMGRIGLQSPTELEDFVQTYEQSDVRQWAKFEGAFTHFSTAGGGLESHVETQIKRWQSFLPLLPDYVTQRHYANSAMSLYYDYLPPSDILRYGIALYGIDPRDTLPDKQQLPLIPALSLQSEIIYMKEIAPNTYISYGATYQSTDNEWIATIPIGYADGWHRHYQSIDVLVDGIACPIVGTINMDHLMIKVPKAYSVGTPVTLIGRDGSLENHVSALAQQVGTIGYEILTSIRDRVPRVYV